MLIISACRQESASKQLILTSSSSLADTNQIKNNDTLKILCYGEKLPELYINVRHIIEKKYMVKYIDVAGCEVTTKLIDSVKIENTGTFVQLVKKYGKNIEVVINDAFNAEYNYLSRLDTYLRVTQKKENNLILIYFVKKPHIYKAYYLFGEPDPKTLHFRLKSVLEIDSASKKTISRTQKDEIQAFNLNHLQND